MSSNRTASRKGQICRPGGRHLGIRQAISDRRADPRGFAVCLFHASELVAWLHDPLLVKLLLPKADRRPDRLSGRVAKLQPYLWSLS